LPRAARLATLAGALLLTPSALADEPKVEINTEIVLASNDGQGVEPASLAPMKDKFLKEGFSFTSFKQLKQQKLVLVRNHAAELKLPNNQVATLKLEEMVDGVAKVHVRLPPIDTTYTVGREGSVFIDGGHHQKGTLVLVLSPAGAH
jgi:hypothetical protein